MGLQRLTHLDGNAIAPDWSPDGTRIVFWLEDQALYVMNRHGGGLHEVTSSGGQAAFTPTGTTSCTRAAIAARDMGSS